MCGASRSAISASGRTRDVGAEEPVARRRDDEHGDVHAGEIAADVDLERLRGAVREHRGRHGGDRPLDLPHDRVGRVGPGHEPAHHRGRHGQAEEACPDGAADRVQERVQRGVEEGGREDERLEAGRPRRREPHRDRARERLGEQHEPAARELRPHARDEVVVAERRVGRVGEDLRAKGARARVEERRVEPPGPVDAGEEERRRRRRRPTGARHRPGARGSPSPGGCA
jgi:hypothetical protein